MNRRKLLTGSLAGALAAGEAHAQATKVQPQAAEAGPGGGETIYVPITVAIPPQAPLNSSFSCTVEIAPAVTEDDGLVMVQLLTSHPTSVGVAPVFIPANESYVTIFLPTKDVPNTGVTIRAATFDGESTSGAMNVG